MSNEAENRAISFLESAVKDYKIFVDTCSILDTNADAFWENLVPILQRENKTVIIPLRVYQEVEKFATDTKACAGKDANLHARAISAQKNIVRMQKANLVQIFGDEHDNFSDNVFQTVFTQFRMKYNLMLVTQDTNLADDIININQSKSVKTKHQILVRRINQYGYLGKFFPQKTVTSANASRVTVVAMPKPATKKKDGNHDIPDEERFAFATAITRVSGKSPVSFVPGESDMVIARRDGKEHTIKLVKQGPSGGEGTIYDTDIPGVVAKIYKKEKIDRAKHEKLKLMLTRNIECEGVCFPLAVLYNTKNEFVGYLMNKARGKELQKCVFIPVLLKKEHPDWKRTDTVQLCITILQKLQYLHERNVILGDINPNNILVESPTEIYFVDTDSYQIEGYPCPVGTINYTAPEIQGKTYGDFLRTIGNERFAVATLLFMIMLPGKPPYSLQGGESLTANIINGDFAYASGSRSTGKAPEGMWRYCWSHLPYYLKNDFYETFRKGEPHSTESTRYSTGDWLEKFERYYELLTNGTLSGQDEMALDLFPTRFKKNINATYVKCKLCGQEVDEDQTEAGICRTCLNKGETYHCAKCGCELVYTNRQKYIRRTKRHELCKNCYERKNMVYSRITCVDCGSAFEITFGQKEFYENKGFDLPKRCKRCIEQKRNGGGSTSSRGHNYYSPSPYSSHTQHTTSPSSNRGGGWCFITTAVCEYLNKPDDCYELMTLRRFRDNWLATTPSGHALIQEYYEIAPRIVSQIDASKDRDAVYHRLWTDYLKPCIRLIELHANEACRDLYKKMVDDLRMVYMD